jgi:hypothetical protein
LRINIIALASAGLSEVEGPVESDGSRVRGANFQGERGNTGPPEFGGKGSEESFSDSLPLAPAGDCDRLQLGLWGDEAGDDEAENSIWFRLEPYEGNPARDRFRFESSEIGRSRPLRRLGKAIRDLQNLVQIALHHRPDANLSPSIDHRVCLPDPAA